MSMQFSGKITSVDLDEIGGDTVILEGHMFDRHCEVEIRSTGIGEILVGQYGLKRDEITVCLGDGGDL